MSAETITLGILTQQVLLVIANHANTAADAVLTAQVRWALHAALRDFVSITESQAFRSDSTFATVVGQKDYDIADDFMTMIDPSPHFVASDYRTLQYSTEQDFRAFELDRSQATGDPVQYMLRTRSASTGNCQMRLWPTPAAIRSIRYYYLAVPAKLYDGTDSTVIDKRLPPNQHHILVWGAVANLPRYLNASADLQVFVQKWNEALAIGRSKSPPVTGQTYRRNSYGVGSGYLNITPSGPFNIGEI